MDSISGNSSSNTSNNSNTGGLDMDIVDGLMASCNNNNDESLPSPSSVLHPASNTNNPAPGRQMTFRDYGERLKELEGENLQLKIRIHLMEQARFGKSWRNSNSHNYSQIGEHQNSVTGDGGLTIATNEIVTEFQKLKKLNETQRHQLVTLENQYKQLQQQNEEVVQREEDLVAQNEELNNKLDMLDRELELMKWKKDEEDDIEKCVKAFTSSAVSSSTNIHSNATAEQNNILQATIEEQKNVIHRLEDENTALKSEIANLKCELQQKTIEIDKLLQKTKRRHEQIEKLKAENAESNSKLTTTCLTMREMGYKLNDANNQNRLLKEENEEIKQNLSAQMTALEQTSMVNAELLRERASLHDKLSMSDKLHNEYGKLVAELKSLRKVCPVDESYVRYVSVGLTRSVSHQEIREDPSPDLGIETDQEALAASVAHHAASHDMVSSGKHSSSQYNKAASKYKLPSYQGERDLTKINSELAFKLRHTKQALDNTLRRLDKTNKEKEDFEKAICRQLHRTHIILQEAQVEAVMPPLENDCIGDNNATVYQDVAFCDAVAFTQKC